MKTLGVLGGMSWESTAVIYRLLNEGVARRLGGLHSAPLRLASVDFAPIAALQRLGDWATAARELGAAAAGLRAAGAQGLLIATNTMHLVADEIERAAGLPLLHVVDAAAAALLAAGHRRVALLGTRFTMEEPFYRARLAERHGIEVVVPGEADRLSVHTVIFDELCRGVVRDASRDTYLAVIERCKRQGATAALLACTEIGLLLPEGTPAALPLFDTTVLHTAHAVEWMLTA